MKHFVVYHHPDTMGYTVDEGEGMSIVTSKPVEKLIGNRVWLLTGEGKPRKYYLHSTFVVDSVKEDVGARFPNVAQGRGRLFKPAIELGNFDWFSQLRRSQQNFRFGLHPVTDESLIRELLRVGNLDEG